MLKYPQHLICCGFLFGINHLTLYNIYVNLGKNKMKLRDLFNADMSPNWEVFEQAFPEMTTSKHSLKWHKEGSPLEHTKMVTTEMEKLLKNKCGYNSGNYDDKYLILMSSAMLHDIGKPTTTYWDENKQDWCCKSHGEAGERLFRNIFREERIDLREKVAYIIRYHMLLHNVLDKPIDKQEKIISQLVNGTVPFKWMLLLNECDMLGSVNEENSLEFISNRVSILERIAKTIKRDYKWNYVDDNTIKVYVMIGVAGSGKSTYAKRIQEQYKNEYNVNIPIISRDLVRIELGFCKEGEKYLGSKDEESQVTKIVDERIKNICNERKSFIIDNTSLKKKVRKQYTNLCRQYNAVPVYIYVEAPSMEENIERRKGQIKEDVIRKMWNTMEFPTKDECFNLLLINPNDNDVIVI